MRNVRSVTATNPLNSELNPICHPLALLEAHHILHVNRIWVKEQFNASFSVDTYTMYLEKIWTVSLTS